MKKIIALFLTLAALVSLVGCSKKDSSEQSTSKVEENSIIESFQVDFGQEFTIKTGEIAKIGNEKVYFEMEKGEFLETEEESITKVYYQFTVADKTYKGVCMLFNTGEMSRWTNEPIPYDIVVLSATMDSITLIIHDIVIPDSPLTLSGNASDKITTTKLEYIETERFIVYLDVGVTVEGDLIKNIEKLMTDIEEATQLSYDAYLTGEKVIDNTLQVYYKDYRKFMNVDLERNKISIYVVNDENISAGGFRGGVILTPEDILFHNGDELTSLMHELIHCIHLSNGQDLGKTLSEGLATYITVYINDKDKNDNYTQNWRLSYAYYDKNITASNAEQLFLTENDWNAYLYGFRFMTYLTETYGIGKFNEILKEFPLSNSNSPTSEEVAKVIKEKTSNNVFVDFGNWYQKNKGKFNA